MGPVVVVVLVVVFVEEGDFAVAMARERVGGA